ncbi:hypothetical protein LPJ63_000148 [Coemansia sp. RSA 2711]|nr:hypothetical protein LPJ63_000148 [Coemansia sp. RSA 2711]
MDVALPGQIVTFDFRDSQAPAPSDQGIPRPLRVVQWNIERGYQLDAVIATLRDLDADILCLQELDIGNQRSGGGNHAEQIARRLRLNGAVAVEFQELRSPCRAPAQQGGGLHGNAIYSRYDMAFRAVGHAPAYDWPRDGMRLGEPRLGARVTLAAEIRVPRRPAVLAYSAHFECFAGIAGRAAQLCDLLQDSSACVPELPHQLVFGDFNTFAHSLARLSPRYAHGWHRFRNLGMSEAEWWVENVLAWSVDDGPVNLRLAAEPLPDHLRPSREVLRAARNPGWWDPFDPVRDITISNHCGWMSAKADWAFVRQFRVVRHWMANRDFTASDHRCLVLEVEHAHADTVAEHMLATKRVARELQVKRASRLWTWCSLAAAAALSWAAFTVARRSSISRITGHRGRYGHEFFRFEIDNQGYLKYANNSNYRRDSIIHKSLRLSPTLVAEFKRIVDDSEIMAEDSTLWPRRDENGRLQLDISLNGKSISFETAKISSLADTVDTQDPEGLRVLYYLIQDFKCLILSIISLHFKIKPIA